MTPLTLGVAYHGNRLLSHVESNMRDIADNRVYATEAAYDAGARQIFVWGYRGSEGNNYRAKQLSVTWRAACDGFERILNKERDRIIATARRETNE